MSAGSAGNAGNASIASHILLLAGVHLDLSRATGTCVAGSKCPTNTDTVGNCSHTYCGENTTEHSRIALVQQSI